MAPCVAEHAEIRNALEDRDKDLAVGLIEKHLSDAYERLMKMPLQED
jgi:DNA-binding GntR family transcriptional regulator